MTPDIWKLVGVLVVAISLFVSRRLRVDLVAMMVLVSLVLLGLVSPHEALSGFSNPAVVTVWAVFILSGGLAVTGIAGVVGRRILQVAGHKEIRLVVVIMVTAGTLSAFMNNVGVAALLLPVVMDICRRTKIPPSKLLIPLAYSSLLGGLMTLIGTPPNLLVSEALSAYGEEPFQLFSFTPMGASVMVAGVLFMALIGRRLLPVNESIAGGQEEGELAEAYRVQEELSVIEVRPGSQLAGKALKDTGLGSLLGVNVLAILKDGRHRLAPTADTVLEEGNRLLVEGDPERLENLAGRGYLSLEARGVLADQLVSADIEVAEVGLTPGTDLEGKNLREVDFRRRFGLVVLAIRRDAEPIRTGLAEVGLKLGDVLLVLGGRAAIDALRSDPDFIGAGIEHASSYHLEDRLMRVVVPDDSVLVGKTLVDSQLGDRFGLGVMGILRGGANIPVPAADERIEAGDVLFMKGKPEDLETVDGLHHLELVPGAEAAIVDLESARVGLAEAVISPRADIVGRTLRGLHFREKYGLNVVAISRQGKILRTDLAGLPLQFGDALLLHGPRKKLQLLGGEGDFIVLRGDAQQPVRDKKAPVAALIMGSVVLSVIVGWLPIYIAAIAGAMVMVLSNCLTMEEAYSYIEWRAVFLIAGMIPLGVAMQQTGAAELFTEVVISAVSGYGPLAVAAALFIVTALGAQVMPTAAVAILMAPIAYNTATDLGISPYSLMMAVAMSASASFLSPVAHPANVLIMGPGGYQWGDYIKVGLPLTLVCMVVVLILLPILWPF